MAYVAHPSEFNSAVPYSYPKRGTPVSGPRRGFWRRLRDAVMLAHQRDFEREIARYVGRSGGRLTDSMEREIAERFFGNSSRGF